jgi:hypothetical protein
LFARVEPRRFAKSAVFHCIATAKKNMTIYAAYFEKSGRSWLLQPRRLMKKHQPQGPSILSVPPPPESLRDSLGDRRAAAHLYDPNLHWQHVTGASDFRPQVAAGGALQRIRARQTEMRTTQQCHVRVHRRTQTKAY